MGKRTEGKETTYRWEGGSRRSINLNGKPTSRLWVTHALEVSSAFRRTWCQTAAKRFLEGIVITRIKLLANRGFMSQMVGPTLGGCLSCWPNGLCTAFDGRHASLPVCAAAYTLNRRLMPRTTGSILIQEALEACLVLDGFEMLCCQLDKGYF